MCGFAGKLSPSPQTPVDRGLIRAMGDAVAHRGPDAEGFYFGEGYIDPRKESAMRKETEILLREIRNDALTLVEAFGIPDVTLAAPIAFMDPAHAPF